MINVYLYNIKENYLADSQICSLEIISSQISAKSKNLIRATDNMSHLIGLTLPLIHLLIIDELDYIPHIIYGNHGKPNYFINNKILECSISHSHNWVACAVAECCIGIDIEYVCDIDFVIAERFFSPDENDYLELFAENHLKKRDAFFDVWTRKESYLKAIGDGFFRNLTSFSVCNNSGQMLFDVEKYSMQTLEILDEYRISICSQEVIDNDNIKFCYCNVDSINNLIKHINKIR